MAAERIEYSDTKLEVTAIRIKQVNAIADAKSSLDCTNVSLSDFMPQNPMNKTMSCKKEYIGNPNLELKILWVKNKKKITNIIKYGIDLRDESVK